MDGPRFSDLAIRDLEEIDDYSVRQWGEKRAEHYLVELAGCCNLLVKNPEVGRLCPEILPRLRRMAYGKHVVFYSVSDSEVFIWRILHQTMVPDRHVFRVPPE